MNLYFITQQFKARRVVYDEKKNILWMDPNFKEKFLKGQQVGFNLNLLKSIEQYPALCQKVTSNTRLVYFTLHLKELNVAIGVDEKGLDLISMLKIPDIPNITGSPLIYRKLK